MCNEPAFQISTNYYSWGCEVLRNLSYLEDLSLLDDLDLGEQGREVYSKLWLVAQEEKSSWHAYAVAVYFRVAKSWVKGLMIGNDLHGQILHSFNASRRNTQDKDNLR